MLCHAMLLMPRPCRALSRMPCRGIGAGMGGLPTSLNTLQCLPCSCSVHASTTLLPCMQALPAHEAARLARIQASVRS